MNWTQNFYGILFGWRLSIIHSKNFDEWHIVKGDYKKKINILFYSFNKWTMKNEYFYLASRNYSFYQIILPFATIEVSEWKTKVIDTDKIMKQLDCLSWEEYEKFVCNLLIKYGVEIIDRVGIEDDNEVRSLIISDNVITLLNSIQTTQGE